jgi:plasmid maintenance system antidote protein VapI
MTGSPAAHFGRVLRRERTARGWSLDELARRTGIAAAHLSRIENGRRPPTEKIATACDSAFPERRDYFSELYAEMRTWAPPGFRDWPEYEDRTSTIREWSPMVVTGMLQTADYARALLAIHPEVSPEVVSARLASRMARQQRVLLREADPPKAIYIIDHAALYRQVGSPEVMVGQCAHLAEVAALPHVTLQVFPAVACPATQGGFLLADDAAFAETVVGGYVYVAETITALASVFDTLRGESYRVSESLSIIRKAGELWTSESRATQVQTVATA